MNSQTISQPILQSGNNNYEAYFTLRSWAHCKDEMEIKPLQDFQKMEVYYTTLEKDQGSYWNALCEDAWAQAFKQVYSSKK